MPAATNHARRRRPMRLGCGAPWGFGRRAQRDRFGCGAAHATGAGMPRSLPAVAVPAALAAPAKKPVMADAMEALRAHVNEEASDERVGVERHGGVARRTLDG
jgi:hypothetical protein